VKLYYAKLTIFIVHVSPAFPRIGVHESKKKHATE